jgi:transcriptional regulator with XRE-family HTH domain
MSQFGKQISLLRKAGGWSLQQLATAAGVSRFTIQRIEGGADVRLQTLDDVLRVMGVELMLVPIELRQDVAQFIQSNGRVLGRQPGIEAPKSIVDLVSQSIATQGIASSDPSAAASGGALVSTPLLQDGRQIGTHLVQSKPAEEAKKK